jgi:hypothetical protein
MTIFTFSGLSLRNADGSPSPYATVPIFAKSDTSFSTPLSALDMSGTTVLPGGVTADGNGDVPDFKVDVPGGVPRVVAHAAGFQDREILSIDEMVSVVQAAAVSSAASAADAEAARTNALGAQAAAEAARAETLAAVKTVNGQRPDAAGNVNVAGGGIGTGSVVTVNSKGPDGSGNVTLVPGDVGAAAASHTHPASAIASGVLPPARLGTGSTGGTTRYLREDGQFAVPPTGGGSGTGSVDSVNGVGPDGSGNVELSKTADAAKPVSTLQAAAIAAKANDSAVVKLTGNQTVAGVKTFSSPPVVPDNSFTTAKVAGLAAALAGNVTSTTAGLQIVVLTAAAYNALSTPRPSNVLYVKVG